MWVYSVSNILRHLAQVTIFIVALLCLGCTESTYAPIDVNTVNITGMWEYEQIIPNNNTNENTSTQEEKFTISHFHVGLVDNGNMVTIQNCFSSTNRIFSRSGNYLVNNEGHKLQIVSGDTIASDSVPDLTKLSKIKPDIDHFHNAGSVVLQSNAIPNVSVNSEVCAQRIAQQGSDKLHLQLSIPFEHSYMDIELEIDDLNESRNNITKMSFYSPAFSQYFDNPYQESLNGHATFTRLSHSRITLDFDIWTVKFNVFPDANIVGSIDVSF